MYKHYLKSTKNQKGMVLFYILIAVILFSVLSYTVIRSFQGNGKNASDEVSKLDTAQLENYTAEITAGALRLQFRGCGTVFYTIPSEQSVSGDKSCFIFHQDGAGVIYQEADLEYTSCGLGLSDESTLEIGEKCGDLIYAGTSGGNRLYVNYTLAQYDQQYVSWQESGCDTFRNTDARSSSDGLSNTNKLVALPLAICYLALECRNRGSEWYLPATDELMAIANNKNIGYLAQRIAQTDIFWSSTEFNNNGARWVNFSSNSISGGVKTNAWGLLCIRR